MEDRRVRIQPPDLCIREEDPFGSDRLGRKESAEVLTRIVSRIEGPCVLALDAPWGYGKTTFLKMWEAWLRQDQGFPVVACFNAWETDFTNHPFLALSSELTKELESCIETAIVEKFKDAAQQAQKVLRVASALAPLVELLQSGAGMVVGAASSTLAAAMSGEADTNSYQEAKEAITNFKESLGELAQGFDKDKPMVIMIDELDRCRPSYAVELLEVAKHLFAVDKIVFVLAVNRAELVHSIKALYGSDFDAEGYFRRFFDLDFQLPKPGRGPFVQDLLTTTRLATILDPRIGPDHLDEVKTARALLDAFLDSSDLSLRQVQQAVHRLALTMKLLPPEAERLPLAAVIAVVLRTANPVVYQHFAAGVATDKDVVDAIFKLQGPAALRSVDPRNQSFGWWIEVRIVLGILAMNTDRLDLGSKPNSPLLVHYRKLCEQDPPDDAGRPDEQGKQYARTVLDRVEDGWKEQKAWALGFQTVVEAINRLELLSPELGANGSV